MDYKGGDLKMEMTNSIDDCCRVCKENSPSCKYFTYVRGSCYLKTNKGSPISDSFKTSDMTSGDIII